MGCGRGEGCSTRSRSLPAGCPEILFHLDTIYLHEISSHGLGLRPVRLSPGPHLRGQVQVPCVPRASDQPAVSGRPPWPSPHLQSCPQNSVNPGAPAAATREKSLFSVDFNRGGSRERSHPGLPVYGRRCSLLCVQPLPPPRCVCDVPSEPAVQGRLVGWASCVVTDPRWQSFLSARPPLRRCSCRGGAPLTPAWVSLAASPARACPEDHLIDIESGVVRNRRSTVSASITSETVPGRGRRPDQVCCHRWLEGAKPWSLVR